MKSGAMEGLHCGDVKSSRGMEPAACLLEAEVDVLRISTPRPALLEALFLSALWPYWAVPSLIPSFSH